MFCSSVRSMRSVLLVAALVLIVAGCGDAGTTPTDVPATTAAPTAVPATTAATTATPVGTTTTLPVDAGTTATTTARPEVDACVLVDAADAASILGAPASVDATPGPSFGEVSTCAWVTVGDALLVVTVFEGRQFYGGGTFPDAEPLGVGDEGYIGVDAQFGGVNLQFVQDQWVIGLSAAPFGIADVPGLPAAMTAAAQQAASRLP